MVDVYWFEQDRAEVPANDSWLSQAELACLRPNATLKRRSDWRHGRWVAKNAAARYLGLSVSDDRLCRIHVIPNGSGAPGLFRNEEPLPAAISITHSSGLAACVIGPPDIKLGCDIETVEARSACFLSDFFNFEERNWIAARVPDEVDLLSTALWCGKECALKALAEGLRLDTRTVSVQISGHSGGWAGLSASHSGLLFRGWWKSDGPYVRAVVCSAPTNAPVTWS